MCSRLASAVLLAAALLLVPGLASASEVGGGHRLELSLMGGRLDFDDAIRFEDDAAVGVRFMASMQPWWQLGMQFDHIGAQDSRSGRWQDILVASIQTRLDPRPDARWSPTAGVGVSFMAFENDPKLDAVAEGLDLSLGARWTFDESWRLRAELLGRVQTFTITEVDSNGIPTGGPEETGYRWSLLWQLGLGRAF